MDQVPSHKKLTKIKLVKRMGKPKVSQLTQVVSLHHAHSVNGYMPSLVKTRS